jgi:hypothetical protein
MPSKTVVVGSAVGLRAVYLAARDRTARP